MERWNRTQRRINPNDSVQVSCNIADMGLLGNIHGIILTADRMQAMNTFENPNKVKLESYSKCSIDGTMLKVEMPSKSVVLLRIK